MIRTLLDLFQIADCYHDYLSNRGVSFDIDGFPLIERSCFLSEYPNIIAPYSHRNARFVADPTKTAICFYMSDDLNYRRLEHVIDDVEEYRRFMAVASMDITVTEDMDDEWQAMIMLVNALFLAMIAVNGIKVIANIRCGGKESRRYLSWIPRGVSCLAGMLGCDPLRDESDLTFIKKVIQVGPDPLFLYGKQDEVLLRQLQIMGVSYRHYEDAHCISKKITFGITSVDNKA